MRKHLFAILCALITFSQLTACIIEEDGHHHHWWH